MYPIAPRRKTKKDAGLPGCTREEVTFRVEQLPPVKKARVQSLLDEVAHDDFWRWERFVQIVRMIDWMDTYGVKQNDIAFVLDVSKALVSCCKSAIKATPLNAVQGLVQRVTSNRFTHRYNSSLTGEIATKRQ